MAKRIIVRIDGGVLSPVKIPQGMELVVRDYDVDGNDGDSRLYKDKEGGTYRYEVFDRFDVEGK